MAINRTWAKDNAGSYELLVTFNRNNGGCPEYELMLVYMDGEIQLRDSDDGQRRLASKHQDFVRAAHRIIDIDMRSARWDETARARDSQGRYRKAKTT